MGPRLRVRNGTNLKRVELNSQRLGSKKHFHTNAEITTSHHNLRFENKPYKNLKGGIKQFHNHNPMPITLFTTFLFFFLLFSPFFSFFFCLQHFFLKKQKQHTCEKHVDQEVWITMPLKQTTNKVPKVNQPPKQTQLKWKCCSTKPWYDIKNVYRPSV